MRMPFLIPKGEIGENCRRGERREHGSVALHGEILTAGMREAGAEFAKIGGNEGATRRLTNSPLARREHGSVALKRQIQKIKDSTQRRKEAKTKSVTQRRRGTKAQREKKRNTKARRHKGKQKFNTEGWRDRETERDMRNTRLPDRQL
jgi:hypothetical protein